MDTNLWTIIDEFNFLSLSLSLSLSLFVLLYIYNNNFFLLKNILIGYLLALLFI